MVKRDAIANYLRSGTLLISLMEHTRDVLGRFEMPGGSAIHSDGTYYWRSDTSEYVHHYGVGLPVEFLDHGERLGWKPRPLTNEEAAAIETYLESNIARPRRR